MLEELLSTLAEGLKLPWLGNSTFWFQSFALNSAFCPLYLASAVLCSLLWWYGRPVVGVRSSLISEVRTWRQHRSTIQVDGLWALFHIVFLRVPIGILHLKLFAWSYARFFSWGEAAWGSYIVLEGPRWFEALCSSVVTMLAIDCAAYGVHRAMHQVSWLWSVHRVHHSASFLTPLTNFRQHPCEPLLLNGVRGLAAGCALGLLHSVLPSCTPIWTVGGMGVGFFVYMFTVHLHHAPLPVRYPKYLSSWLVSPHMHHIHHSKDPRHHGKNFGVVFSLWDRFFGTLCNQELACDQLEFGLEITKTRRCQTFAPRRVFYRAP